MATEQPDGGSVPLRAADYERREGGRVTILRGHPAYCPNEQAGHASHEFRYSYIDQRGQRVDGRYACFGEAPPWA